MPRTRIGAPNNSDTVVPNSPAQSATRGNRDGGTPNIRHKSASHCPLEISNSSVRAALLASVKCAWPPVRRHNKKQSMVPKASRPASAKPRAPLTCSSSQAILLAEK